MILENNYSIGKCIVCKNNCDYSMYWKMGEPAWKERRTPMFRLGIDIPLCSIKCAYKLEEKENEYTSF